ncbi:P-loop containing nucleoside triphosphate hydrolase protein [Protomyces lactucae-debilis]|uniref:RNA helicase n=1 Tax=Protomyces lactucae-debilis TaxID=2754530 RepID=A0A1Y2EV79_PROLT|nr:P-loop containing nucleoside triphosphate hydrolase protein [Protomyces lactucae-debilis]ORY75478.1 P-loop containing nucleoside triphosphate hydrolase protein [Protomyces lactucae-debilis]
MPDTAEDEDSKEAMDIDEQSEVDPLEAFMAQNSTALAAPVSVNTRSAQDVLNDASDREDAVGSDLEEDILAIAARRAAQKKKDFATVDHAKENYEPFRKEFYIEPQELAHLTEEEVDAMRLELDGIVIRGKDCPKPMTHWGQCGLSAPVVETIRRLGYDTPTSIQAQAIPAIMAGRDAIGVAKTGSGKTVAFLLPMFRHIMDQRPLANGEGPIAMIMTPTRELAVQIHKECKPFIRALNLRAICAYGGPPIKDQIAELKRGAEIVVCTPGRMIDLLSANQGRVTNLKRVTYCVLDEADRMFDLGFEPQVMKILNNIRPQRQTVLFSATFPRTMEALARKILRGKPVEITVGARSVVAPEITQMVEVRPRDPDPQKFNRVLEILGELYNRDEDARTLIFVDRQEAADNLLAQLMRKGYPCNSLHGGKDQADRDNTISDFKAGVFPIMIATSVAARGLDVKQLKLVINYDCPNHMEDYVHRVGRTGRAGNKGTAITFVSEDQERYAADIAKALRLSQVEIPEPLKKLSDAFLEKVKAGTERQGASGFGGKGLGKFDVSRDLAKKVQRKIYGEEDDQEDEDEQAKEERMQNEALADTDRVNPEEAAAVQDLGSSAVADAPIKVERVSASSAKLRPVARKDTRSLDPVAAAKARIEAINNRLNLGGAGKAVTPEVKASNNLDAGDFRAMMEINDYPQKARWNVTNRTNIAKVLEATGTSITTQGQYVKPGSTAVEGVPKLYLLIEGPSEETVVEAVKELRRLLSEGTLADDGGTRYKVV